MDDVIELQDYREEKSKKQFLDQKLENLWEKEDYGNLIRLERYFEIDFPDQKVKERAENYLEEGKIQEIYALKKINGSLPLEEETLENSVRSLYRTGNIDKGASIEEFLDYKLPEEEFESIITDYLSTNSFRKLEKLKKNRVEDFEAPYDFVQEKYVEELMPESFSEKDWQNGFKISKKTEKLTDIEPEEETVRETYRYLARQFQPHYIEKLERWSGVEVPEEEVRDILMKTIENGNLETEQEKDDTIISFPSR